MHLPPLLLSVALALAYALAGGAIARLLRLPPIIGYLLAGVALGPSTPGFVGDSQAIGELAELGIIFLMFGVGLHFSFKDLWEVRDIAIPGALFQMGVATAAGYALARWWGWTPASSLMLGISISVASTVVLLRALMDRGLLATPHGRVAVGWLVLEDIATVVILVLLPASVAAAGGGSTAAAVAITIGKALLFVALMIVAGARAIPWLLRRVVRTQSRELFILTAITIALGTAMLSAAWFGVSRALGAFVAGVVVNESPYSHQVGADLLPFREAFAVLFFVSVGMLVDPPTLVSRWHQIAALTALIVVGKSAIAIAVGLVFRRPATALVVAAGLSQIGEFSFIVGQTAVSLDLMDRDQYAMILAGAIVSITLNPLMFALIDPVQARLARVRFWRWLERSPASPVVVPHELHDHVVIVGSGRVGRHVSTVLGALGVPRLVVEANPLVIETLEAMNVPTLFGDAANSEVLDHASLSHARALVVTLPDDAAAAIVVAGARRRAPELPIAARASTWAAARDLRQLGADGIVRPELEGGLQLVRRTLTMLGFPWQQVHAYVERLRRNELEEGAHDRTAFGLLEQLAHGIPDLELEWHVVDEASDAAASSLLQANVRARTGASVAAIMHDGVMVSNPGPDVMLHAGDQVALMGSESAIAAAASLLGKRSDRPN